MRAAVGGHAIIATGNSNVTIGVTLEQYEAGLKRKEQEVRGELRAAGAADKEKTALLEKQLADIQSKLDDPESALADYKAKLAEAYKAFDDLKRELLPEQIKQAQDALIKGHTAEAENLFIQVLDRGTENAAEAAYQLGRLAYSRIDYQAANRYYSRAIDLQPNNPLFLNAAGFIAYRASDYTRAELLYQQALAIWERTLGFDHPNVATSLNNLALLYGVQGLYGKAEMLHQRALTIDEKALRPDHPDLATDLSNLAGLYYEQKYLKAEPLYQRARVIWEKGLGSEHPTVAAESQQSRSTI